MSPAVSRQRIAAAILAVADRSDRDGHGPILSSGQVTGVLHVSRHAVVPQLAQLAADHWLVPHSPRGQAGLWRLTVTGRAAANRAAAEPPAVIRA